MANEKALNLMAVGMIFFANMVLIGNNNIKASSYELFSIFSLMLEAITCRVAHPPIPLPTPRIIYITNAFVAH